MPAPPSVPRWLSYKEKILHLYSVAYLFSKRIFLEAILKINLKLIGIITDIF